MSKTLNVKWKLILTCTVRRVWGSSMLSVNPFTINFHSPSIRQYEFRHVPPTCYWDGRGLVLRVLYCTWRHVCLRKNIHTTQLIKSILPRGLALSCNPSYTWKARTVGWLETERVITPFCGRLIRPPNLRRPTEEVRHLWREEARLHAVTTTEVRVGVGFPSQRSKTQCRPSSQYCNCTKPVKNPIQKSV